MKRYILLCALIALGFNFTACTEKTKINTKTENNDNPTGFEITEESSTKSEKEEGMIEKPTDIPLIAGSNLKTWEKTANQAISILNGHKKKNNPSTILSDSDKAYNLRSLDNIHVVEVITGEYSINKTKTNYDIGGTDLGIMFNKGDKTYIAFGDTLALEGMTGNWRSNTLAVTTDGDYTDGINFDYMITNSAGAAKEIISSKKIDYDEKTCIPTGGIAIGDTLYLSYMSVNNWDAPEGWHCNFGSVVKSTDDGQTWQKLNNLKWPGNTSFCQMCPVVVEDTVYVMGVTGGRKGIARLMRVSANEYEDFGAYEYLVGHNDDGSPIFEKGEEAMNSKYAAIPAPCGELSLMYSEYLEEWVVTYISNDNMVMRTSKELWGPWSNRIIIASQSQYPGLYGAFMNPRYVSEDGKKFGFLMSIWTPVYNVVLMEAEFVRKDEIN